MQTAVSLDCSEDASPLQATSQKPAEFVRLSLRQLSELSDSALNDYIQHCAESMIAAHQRWKTSSNFADIGQRDACWHAEADALIERGNRPHLVARMERERGLA